MSCSRLEGFVVDLIVAIDSFAAYCHGPLGTSGPTTMPPTEDQRSASVTYARTTAFSELDHQLLGHSKSPTWACGGQ